MPEVAEPNVTPKRIMLMIHSMRGGGSERQMSYLANELSHRCHTSLVTLDTVDNDRYRLNKNINRIGLELTSEQGGLFRGAVANWKRVKSIAEAARSIQPDCILSFCDSTNILTAIACGRRYPVILCERSDPRHQRLSRIWEWIRPHAYRRARVCIAQTDEVRDYLRNLINENASKPIQWLTIPSAIVVPDLDWNAIRAQREQASIKRLIYVGRLSHEKRIDRLMHAWSSLAIRHNDWKLAIVGDGPESSKLKSLAIDLKIDTSIDWRGWSSNVWDELTCGHAYALTSQYEGFPQSMLEAMACELPCVVFDCSPAIREVIRSDAEGFTVSNQEQLTARLDELLKSQSKRLEMGKAARERARDFAWPVLAEKWLHAIRVACNLS